MQIKSYSKRIVLDPVATDYGNVYIELYSFDVEEGEVPTDANTVSLQFDKGDPTINVVSETLLNDDPVYYNSGVLTTGREPTGENEMSDKYE